MYIRRLTITTILLTFLFTYGYAYAQQGTEKVEVGGYVSSDPLSQTYQGYVKEFQNATATAFTEEDLNRIFADYSSFILTAMDTEEFSNALQGLSSRNYFALEKIKDESFYRKSIETLLHSQNINQRILGYITVASAGDHSFNDLLLRAVKNETVKAAKLWAGMSLLYLKDKRTSELFDFLVANEDFGDAHMLPLYLTLDQECIRKTAYEKIKSKNEKARILAVQSLSVTGLSPETERVVKEAIKTWRLPEKGYAIYTAKELQMGELKSILSPLLTHKSLREISLAALANSPSQEDQDFLFTQVPENSAVSDEVLNAYLKSTREASVRKWLTLIRDKKISSSYIFFVFDQPLLSSDNLLDDVRNTLRKTPNLKVLQELPRTLSGRSDDESVNILLDLLSNPDSTVRYWAAFSLKGNKSPKLVKLLPDLIRNQKLRTVALTDLAIQNKIDGLQDEYESLMHSENKSSTDWIRSALDYLAAFPREKDRELFRTILQNNKDTFSKRTAVSGLGELKDMNSIPLIVQALHQESPHDQNAITYLIALGKIGGDTSKQIIESYKNSKIDAVRDLVSKLLADWKK